MLSGGTQISLQLKSIFISLSNDRLMEEAAEPDMLQAVWLEALDDMLGGVDVNEDTEVVKLVWGSFDSGA